MDLELCRKFFAEKHYSALYVGFSGGADSTAALLTALYFSKEYGFSVTAVHFDHHLRGEESDADVLFCRDFARQRGIPFLKIDLTLPFSGSIENTARQERLKHWQNLVGSHKDRAVILGHHNDDRRENFFLRLLRGANLSGLISPKYRTTFGGVEYLRPLLCFSRKEIENFLLQQGISHWRIDSTNLQSECSRNCLRLEILPALYKLHPGAYAGIAHALDTLEQDADFLEQEAAKYFDLRKIHSRAYWRSLHPAIAARVIRLWKNEIPTADFLQRLQEELQRPAPSEMRQISWNQFDDLSFLQDQIFWENKKNKSAEEEKIWCFSEGPCTFGNWLLEAAFSENAVVNSKFEAVFDADLLGNQSLIAFPQAGEKMTLFGTGESRKIKKLRIDAQIPSHWKLPVIKTVSGKIIWAPGIRHSNLFPVTENRLITCKQKQTGRIGC